jgi:O-antigen biosynthesis protein
LDDDNYLVDNEVLEDLRDVDSQWVIFPILRYGERFFNDPPGIGKTDTGSFIIKREIGQWPALTSYDADSKFAAALAEKYPYKALPEMRPLIVMPASLNGSLSPVEITTTDRVSIFTPVHSNIFLREAYESIKSQDFFEWVVVYNNGGVPMDFGDSRVKSHILYKAPGKIGTLKSYACARATGDILLELDCDDMLAPTAIEDVKLAFSDPKVGFAYSNAIHTMGDLSKFPRYDESYGWKYRETKFQGHEVDEFISFKPTPEAVSRVWFGPDHFRAFRRSTYQQIGGHDTSLKVLDDSELVMRMYLATEFAHIDKPLYLYRVHGQNSWLQYNQDIQDGVWPLYDRYIVSLIRRWAQLSNLPVIEVEKWRDLHSCSDSSVAVLFAIDSFAKFADPLETMKEVYRVLVPGGWLICQVPSTDGRGAVQDPRHVSYWNQNSFLYYTNKEWAKYLGTPVRFQAVRLYTTEKNDQQVCWTIAHLVSLKDGYRPPGLLEI